MSRRKEMTVGALLAKTRKIIREGDLSLPLGNDSTIHVDLNIPDDYNTVLYGPITINSGASLTIGDNADLYISKLSDTVPVEVQPTRFGSETFVIIDGSFRVIDKENS